MNMSMSMSSSMASMTATTTAAASSATSNSMDMDMGSSSCQISMLWNWYTVDSCFISSTWHITSKGMFAGSCIGVILLVIALEGLRRGQRELDQYLHRINAVNAGGSDAGSSQGLKGAAGGADRLRLWQHLLRSLLFMVQFAVGYFVMLLAMYYNGYFIICIVIGAFLGAAIFQWDTYGTRSGPETKDSCCN